MKLSCEEKRINRAKRDVEKFNRDPDFKFLHDYISDVFTQFLRSDSKRLSLGDSRKINLAAKWCPSINSSFNRLTLPREPIAKKLFPREKFSKYEGVEETHYAYRVRDCLMKEVFVPLRKAPELLEVFIGANDKGLILYNRVASITMKMHKEKFLKHDKERFQGVSGESEGWEGKDCCGRTAPSSDNRSSRR